MVGFRDGAGQVERQVADRRALVQIAVALERRLERRLRLEQLLVLQLQLDLVDAELVRKQRGPGRIDRLRQRARFDRQHSLGVLAHLTRRPRRVLRGMGRFGAGGVLHERLDPARTRKYRSAEGRGPRAEGRLCIGMCGCASGFPGGVMPSSLAAARGNRCAQRDAR